MIHSKRWTMRNDTSYFGDSEQLFDGIGGGENVSSVSGCQKLGLELLDIRCAHGTYSGDKWLITGLQGVAGVQAADVVWVGREHAQAAVEFDLQAEKGFERRHGGGAPAERESVTLAVQYSIFLCITSVKWVTGRTHVSLSHWAAPHFWVHRIRETSLSI